MAGIESGEVLRQQRILLKNLQDISQKRPILVQHDLRDKWHPLPCKHDRPILTRSILPREIVLDFDAPEWGDVALEAGKLKAYLDAKGIPYWLAWTGGKGIHVHIFMQPSTKAFDDGIQEAIKSGDMDVLRVAREAISGHLVQEAWLDTARAKLDPLKVSWSKDTKGSMIREFGAMREDGSCKTLLDAIPQHRPKPGELPLGFPGAPVLWDVSEYHPLIEAALNRQLESMKRDRVEMSEYDGIASDVPCYRYLLRGLDEGTRNRGAHDLARMGKLLGVPREDAEKDLIAYAHNCKGANGELEKEVIATFEGVWKRVEKNKQPGCYGLKQRYGEAVCDRGKCPLWKRPDGAPIQEEGPQERYDLAERLLREGTWWEEGVRPALDELAAGENDNKRLHFYSGLASQLENKVHIFAMGDPQQGKSYLQRKIGRGLFPTILIEVSSMSGKSAYYETMAKQNPRFFENKLLLVDEFKDLDDTAKAFLKQVMSAGQDKLTNKTVSDKRKFEEQNIEGMPEIWTNSAETFEDIGAQVMARPFKTNVDESKAQSDRVEEFQKRNEKFGSLRCKLEGKPSKLPLAQAIVELVMRENGIEVLNPFAEFIKLQDNSVRNKRVQLLALVQAVAYANRFVRFNFEVDGKKYLFANLKDNKTAIEIWLASEFRQRYGIPDSYLKVLNLLYEKGPGLTADEVTASYNLTNTSVSSGTIYNRLKHLCEKNLTSSEYIKDQDDAGMSDDDDGVRRKGRPKLRYFRLSNILPISTSDRDVKIIEVSKDELAKEFESYKIIFPLFHLDYVIDVEMLVDILLNDGGGVQE